MERGLIVLLSGGTPHTFQFCQSLVSPGGSIANVGVHGTKVELYMDKLWNRNICEYPPRPYPSLEVPMWAIAQPYYSAPTGKLDTAKLITHRFKFKDCTQAYKIFGAAAEHNALRVLLSM
ncbi:alcohol dehydrogenase [Histoplasma capsulatum H143]|uniref:Alcohol dehydrogenase n=1 Tax=Ajellomyces capsulatus (strain H143) TaxID=544712 RepID=C6H668_AJECH|nr:alcohol dehydrogenase [Histoplasma capsulatum H143]